MALRIPKSREDGFVLFLGLSDDNYSVLERLLSTSKPTVSFGELESQFASSARASGNDSHEIFTMLLSLFSARTSSGKSVKDFVDELIEAVNENSHLKSKLVNAETAKTRFTKLLSLEEGVAISAKAMDILHEQPNTYMSSRVLTDLRPVYKNDATQSPVAAVVVYTLRLTIHENHRESDVFVALDDKDINELKLTLDRAIQKGESLRALFKNKTDFPILETTE